MKIRVRLIAALCTGSAFGVGAAEPGPIPPVGERTSPTASATAPTDAPKPQLVSFTAIDGATLHGWLYVPAGPGPFPAVLYNHGSEKTPGWFPPLGKFWTEHGYAFFVPHRRGHGRSPGEYIVDAQQSYRATEKDVAMVRRHDIALHERANLDVVDALKWLHTQPQVNADKIIVSGISYGGIQTLLTAEKGLGVKAFVSFSPGTMSWRGNPLLHERLVAAVKKAPAPVYLLQASNDYNLGPSEIVGAALKTKGSANRSKLYPAFGDATNPADGHGGFAVRGSEVWGADVLAFLGEVLRR
jgi:carboxymethylenebutenolidase